MAYRERIGWPLWLHLAIFFVLGIAAVAAVALFDQEPRGVVLLPVLVLVVLAVVWWRVRFVAVDFDAGGAAFGFGGLRRRVPRERIVSAAPEAYSAVRYMGWGYRIGWGPRDRAYSVIGYRRGVRLEFDDERGRRWSVFVACSDPAKAIAEFGLEP